MRTDGFLKRYKGNPILTREQWSYDGVNAVFNPGAIEMDGEVLLLVRVEDRCGFSHLTTARSRDGKTNWRIDSHPTLEATEKLSEQDWGLEDPRIVFLKELEKYAIVHVAFSRCGPAVSLTLTEDFKEFERRGFITHPENKDASLFPRKIKDRFALIHRPMVRGQGSIWISFSPDLKYWGDSQVLLFPREGYWDSYRVGLGPPPIETPEGWLILYHGIRDTASGKLYRVGLALLDLDKPWKVIRRSKGWILSPQTEYEQCGDIPGVVFPCGAIVRRDELYLYYGIADTKIGLAIGKTDEILDYLLTG